MDLISVVMPTYNAAKWVTRTIDNLAAQTYPHFELIVADDGSQDDTVSVVRSKLAKSFKNPWQIIELGSNRGPSAARNVALKAAAGTWVQYLDSDDFIAPSKFAVQAAHCARASADVSSVYSPWRKCHVDEGRVKLLGRLVRPDVQGRAPIMCIGGRHPVLIGAGLSRRSALEQIGGWDEALRFWECEDVTFRMAKAGRLECVPSASPLYLWRQHRDKPHIGDLNARYQTIPVAVGWIDLIRRGLDYKSFDEAGLSTRDRRDILAWTAIWARELFPIDRRVFHEYLGKVRKLDPNLAPTYPAVLPAVASCIGYELSEALVDASRSFKDLLLKLLEGQRLRWPND